MEVLRHAQMKAADDAMQMTVLGVQVRIIMENAKITVQLDETKAKAWVTDMHEASTTGKCPVGEQICRTTRFCCMQRHRQMWTSMLEAVVRLQPFFSMTTSHHSWHGPADGG